MVQNAAGLFALPRLLQVGMLREQSVQLWGIICPGCAPRDCTNNAQQLSSSASSRKDDLLGLVEQLAWFGWDLDSSPSSALCDDQRQLQWNQLPRAPSSVCVN